MSYTLIQHDLELARTDQAQPLWAIIDAMAAMERAVLGFKAGDASGLQSYGWDIPGKLEPPWPVIVHRAYGPHYTINYTNGGFEGTPGYAAFAGGERVHTYEINTDVVLGFYDPTNSGLLKAAYEWIELLDRAYCANQYLDGNCDFCMLTGPHSIGEIPYGDDQWFGVRLKMQVGARYKMRLPDIWLGGLA
jgi:hypothetical protein